MLTEPNILVCSDFSPYSDFALKAAEEIRKKTKGQVHVLHVAEVPIQWQAPSVDFLPHYMDEKFDVELLKVSRKELENRVAKVGLSGEVHVMIGMVYASIQEVIKNKNIDLLIMGHKGLANSPFHLGSLAEKMVAASPVPILVTKRPVSFERIAGLVDPTNPLVEIIQVSHELARLFSSKLEIVALFKDVMTHFLGLGKLSFSTRLLSLSEEQKEEVLHNTRSLIKNLLPADSHAQIKVEITIEKQLAYHLNSILEGDHTSLAVMKRHHPGSLEKLLIGQETRRMLELFEGTLLIL